jgi:hypothetical protein
MTDYFRQLGDELSAAAERTRPRRRRGRRVALLAAAALVVAGVPAAAVLDSDEDRGPDEADRLLHTDPILTGTTPRGLRWELQASEDEKGRFCFGTTMPTDDPEELAPAAGVGCGDHEPGELTIHVNSTQPGRHSRDRRRHSLASGTAPDEAASVTITHADGRISVKTLDDPKGIEGRFYVAEIPLRWQRGRRHVVARDAQGKVVARAGG